MESIKQHQLACIKQEEDFLKYLDYLHAIKSEIIIIIVANNTPCGPYFSSDVANQLANSLGLNTSLSNKFRLAYTTFIDSGHVIIEQLATQKDKSIDITLDNSKIKVRMISAGFEGQPTRNCGLIEINGKNCSMNRRGLNFVILRADNYELIDSCSVDTYISDFLCYREDDVNKKIHEYKQQHPDITLVSMNFPVFPHSDLTENEKYIKTHGLADGMVMGNVLSDLDYLLSSNHMPLLKFYHTADEVIEVLSQPRSYTDSYGTRKFFDLSGKHVNTCGGIRLTPENPKKHNRAIFMVGNCCIFGVAASDEHTIASFLQKELNKNNPDEEFIVYNYGYYLMGGVNPPFYDEYKILQSLPVKSGDVVIIGWPFYDNDIYLCDISQAAQRPHEYGEVFFCIDHYTPAGYKLIADKLYDFLKEHRFFPYSKTFKTEAILQPINNEPSLQHELEVYKNHLRDIYQTIKPRIGAIVMNCNPFTLGHRYLVDTALKYCDYLIVFVVEENKSIFPFEDRIELVRKGLADLNNVRIIPSGKFIISTLTFAEYFNKSNLQDVKIDTSMDVTIFAKEIAPCLDISVRFAGSEPFDHVTSQYNQSMHALLSQYGIEMKEIPRYEVDGQAVSASRVRQLLSEEKWDSISKLVPSSTLEYLHNFVHKKMEL